MKLKIASLLLLLLGISAQVYAHSVAQVQTTKYFAPETVQELIDKANAGVPSLQIGDIISYIVEFTPVANGSNIGVQGYVTDYVPLGTEVVAASIVSKDGLGNFNDVAPSLPGNSPVGWGARPNPGFVAPFALAGQANMCEVQADTGIFYSTDARTSVNPILPLRVAQGLVGNGYTITPARMGQLNPYLNQINATTHNLWDANQVVAFGMNVAPVAQPPVRATRISTGAGFNVGSVPFNAGSPVAGLQTGYQLDDTGLVGPWNRISYPGSRMGDQSTGPALVAGVPGLGGVCGFPTSAGYNLSPANPLPSNTNAVRWALGKLQVGEVKYVRISLRITSPVGIDGIVNSSEVFGADTAADDPSTGITTGDNVWLYHVPSVADNNSNLMLLKTVVGYYDPLTPLVLTPSSGEFIPLNSKVRYRVTYLNSGTSVQNNVTLTDTLPCHAIANAATNFAVVSGPMLAPAVPPVTPAGTCGVGAALDVRSSFVFPTIASLAPGVSGAIEYDVQTAAAAAGATNVVTNSGLMTSTSIPGGVTSNAVSYMQAEPNLAISKTTSTPTVSAGGIADYTITVTNNGTAPATNVIVYDFLPSMGGTIADPLTQFRYSGTTSITGLLPVTGMAASPPTLQPNNVNLNQQEVSWNFAAQPLAPGASVSINFSAQVGANVASTPSAYGNNASVTYLGLTVGRKDVSGVAGVTVLSPLELTNTIDCYYNGAVCVPYSGVLPPAAKVKYRLDYTNTSAVPLTNAVLSSTLPCQTAANSVSNMVVVSGAIGLPAINPPVTLAGSCVAPTARSTFAFPAAIIPAGASGSITYDVLTNAINGNLVANDATLSASGVSTKQSQSLASVYSAPNLQISKTSNVSSLKAGNPVTYMITVTNIGTAPATNLVVNDWLPSGGAVLDPYTRFSASVVPDVITGFTPVVKTIATPPITVPYNTNINAANMQELTWGFGLAQQLAPGASLTINFTSDVGVNVPPATYQNNAKVSYQDLSAIPVLGSATAAPNTVQVAGLIADVAVTKTNGATTVTTGTSTTYTITVSNNGLDAADNTKLRDPSVAGLSKTGVTCLAAGGAVCPVTPTVAALEGAGLVIPTLPAGGSVSFDVYTNVTASAGNVTNTASIYLPTGLSDSNWLNNSASDTDAVIAPNLSTSTKSVLDINGGDVQPGDILRYTINVNETGGLATTASITDDIPLNTTWVGLVSKPMGALDIFYAAPLGANFNGQLSVTNINVLANGSASVVFEVMVNAGVPAGTVISNSATITAAAGIGGIANSPSMIVSASAIPSTGNKPLYLQAAQGLSRTPPPAVPVIAGTAIARNTLIPFTWAQAQLLQSPVTIDPLLSASVPVTLYLDTLATRTHNVQVDLFCSNAPATIISQVLPVPLTMGVVTPVTFNLPLLAPMTCPAGSAWGINVTNVGGARVGRDIIVMPVDPVSGAFSKVTLPSQNVINVDVVDIYSAASPAVTQLASYTTGDIAHVRAVVSDPFGSFDISSATVTIRDANGLTVLPNTPMNMIADSLLVTKTFEYAFPIPPSNASGLWTVEVTGNEGTENNVWDKQLQTFNTTFGPYGSASGTVFNDLNGDGVKQLSESGMAGVIVSAYTSGGILVDSYTTNAFGDYAFSSLTVGNYNFRINAPPAGYGATVAQPLPVTITANTITAGNHLGYQAYAQVTGKVFADVNNNGTFEAGDAWLTGATVYLKNGATTVATQLTDASGVYDFNQILIGSNPGGIVFTVDVNQALAPVSNAALTTANDPTTTAAVTVGSTHNLGDIGYFIQGSIAGTVYDDLNGSLAYDTLPLPADAPLNGAVVNLYNAALALIDTYTTNASGAYIFNGLPAGNYTVEVITAAGYNAVSPAAVAPANPQIVMQAGTALASGEQRVGQNFGFIMPPNLQISKTASMPFLSSQTASSLTYTLTVTNSGGAATNVVVTDYLPSIAAPAGWGVGAVPAPALPSPSIGNFVYPAMISPALTTVTLNGLPVVPVETAGVGSIQWSTAAGGFTLAGGDSLVITFTVDSAAVQGTFFNSAAITYGAVPTTKWYPDIHAVSAVRDYAMEKTVVAVNGVAVTGMPTIEVNDVVTYEVLVSNQRGTGRVNREEIFMTSVVDTLPLGFKYVLGSTQLLSPGNVAVPPGPSTYAPALLDPVITPATPTTKEVITYTFNGGVIPNRGGLPTVGDSMVTGPGLGETAGLRFQAIAYDNVSPNSPAAGIHTNKVTTMGARLRSAAITETVIGAPVNMANNAIIKGSIFHEMTMDGVYNPLTTDTPFNAVTVQLRTLGGSVVDSVATDPSGLFVLSAPGAGSYQIVVTDTGNVLVGYSNPIVPTLPVVVTDGALVVGQDFGFVVNGTPGSVSGTIFSDANADGVMNGADAGIAGANVWLRTTLGAIQATVVTGVGGTYSFNNIPAGTYIVDVDNSSPSLLGLYNTPAAASTDPYTVSIVSGVNKVHDFGWASGSIFSGFVFDDSNSDGLILGEPTHPGITLNLVDTVSGLVVRTTTTAPKPVAPAVAPALGSYAFDAVPPGSYRIDVTDVASQLTAYALTTANQPFTPVAAVAGVNYANDFGYFLAPSFVVTKTLASGSLGRGEKMDATITITNNGGGVANLSVADVLPALAPVSPFAGVGVFTASPIAYFFDSTVSITLDGTPLIPATDYVAPVAASATPTYGGMLLPGGSTLEIRLRANDPARNRAGGPNFNGVAIQYGTPAVPLDFPDLASFSISRDVTFTKSITAVNGVAVTGVPTVQPGDLLTFKLNVANTTRARAVAVGTFSDIMPADTSLPLPGSGLNYVLGSSKLTLPGGIPTPVVDPVITPGVVAGVSETLAWPVAVAGSTLAAYPSEVSLTFDAYANAAMLPGTFINQGSVLAGTSFTGTASFVVNYDLAVSKVVDQSTISPGSTINYTISAVNNSPTGVVSNISVNETLVNGFSYVPGSTKINGVAAADPYGTANLPVWNLASIAGGTTTTISFAVAVATWTPDGNYDNLVTLTNSLGTTLATTGPTARVTVSRFAAQPLLTVLKSADAPSVNPGSAITYTVLVTNTGAGVANAVQVRDFLSPYTKLALDPFGNGSIFKFIDGSNASGLLGTATVSYSSDGGVTYTHPATDDTTGHDPAITHFRIDLNGTMNANQAANPSFQIQYQVEVK